MELVFLYGSPAVGKLSVANELSKLTKFRVFHNHLTVDLAEALFTNGSRDYVNYCDKLRYEFMEMAAKHDVDIIFTFCYTPVLDDDFIKKVVSIIHKHRGKVRFVHLSAHKKELEKRVQAHSRKGFGKVKKVTVLRRLLKENSNFPAISYVENLKIDNTTISPKAVARAIMKHYHLKKKLE